MKILATLLLVSGLVFSAAFLMSPPQVHAVDVLGVCDNAPTGSQAPSVCKDRANNQGGANPLVGSDGIITTYIKILALVIGIASVIMIIVSGFRFVLSQGDPKNVASARSSILYSVVGLAIAVFAQLIVTFIISRL